MTPSRGANNVTPLFSFVPIPASDVRAFETA